MLASMIFRKEPFFHGQDNYDQVRGEKNQRAARSECLKKRKSGDFFKSKSKSSLNCISCHNVGQIYTRLILLLENSLFKWRNQF